MARWAISIGQKTRLIIGLSRFRFPLPSDHTSVCRGRVANPFRCCTITASLTLARLATAWPFSWLTSQTTTSWRQGSTGRSAWSVYTQVFESILQFLCPISTKDERGFVVQMPWAALEIFGTSYEDACEQGWSAVMRGLERIFSPQRQELKQLLRHTWVHWTSSCPFPSSPLKKSPSVHKLCPAI